MHVVLLRETKHDDRNALGEYANQMPQKRNLNFVGREGRTSPPYDGTRRYGLHWRSNLSFVLPPAAEARLT